MKMHFLFPARRVLPALTLMLAALAGTLAAPAQGTNGPSTDLPRQLLFPTNHDLLPGKGPISSWKPFPRLWAERRTEFWHHRDADKGAVVFLGDSITQGWNDLAAAFPDLHVANRGIGGDTTRGVLFRLKEDVLELKPAAVVLLIGTNDLGNNGDPSDTADNTELILRALENSDPRLPIVLCKVMPSRKALAPKIEDLNQRLEKLAKGDSRVVLCDTWSIYATDEGTCKPEEFPDMLHPNKAGYAKWEAALKPILNGLKLPTRKVD